MIPRRNQMAILCIIVGLCLLATCALIPTRYGFGG
jgi:hypothetical protein